MIKQEIIESRKECINYQLDINPRLKEIAGPLQYLNIEWFGYGKFFLDPQKKCNKFFWVNTHLESFNWYCANALDNGDDFSEAIRHTKLNETSYFFTPIETNDYIVKAFRELFGLSSGLSIYKRYENYVELWDFSSTQQNSILSGSILSKKIIEILSEYIKYFTSNMEILKLCEQVTINFPDKIDLSNSVSSPLDFSLFLKAIEGDSYLAKHKNREFSLTKRELECLRMLSMGNTMKESAKALGLSPRTIEQYMNNIKQKSNAYLKSDLVKLYHENILI